MKKTSPLLFAIFILLSISTRAQTNAPSTDIPDQSFKIQLTKTEGGKSGWDWTSDEITFSSNKIATKFMGQHERFPAVRCTVMTSPNKPNSMNFTATMKNPGGSTISWEGRITGNEIEGMATWKNLQGSKTYRFSGKAK